MSSSVSPPSNAHALPVQYIKGIGPKRGAVLHKAGITTLYDLLLHIPRRYLDRTSIVTIADLRRPPTEPQNDPAGQEGAPDVRREVTIVGEVRSFRVLGVGHKARFVLILADATGSMQCVWFGGVNYWMRAFRIGEMIAASGQPSWYGSVVQFVHPDLDRLSPSETDSESNSDAPAVRWDKALNTGGLIPLYPSNQDLTRAGFDSAGFRRVIGAAIRSHLDAVRDTLPAPLIAAHNLVPVRDAIRSVHFPQTDTELQEGLRRLKYEELFQFQLKLALKRHWIKEDTAGISFAAKSKLARKLVDSLPFELTRAQIKVINEISADLESSKPMNRLLQGDVGSGKTVVALIAMLIAVESGYQAIFMAPTEILAEQHFKTLSSLLKDIPVAIRLLVGAQRTRLRRDILEDVQRGSAQIIVGTHALFEKGVEFAKLGLIVIDELHRFGVMQRASLRKKGNNPDVLVMTATPIPRTLSLTLYGDLDVCVIDELPKHRKPVKTVLQLDSEKESVFRFVREQVQKGRQAYFVYPLIEESEKLDLKAATVHFEQLRTDVFPDLRLGLLHGRLTSDEKDAVMERFQRREIDVLVATTVIEVGIDVPNASLMVIENAERFGLSQLHQLRGRVGRGSEQSYCILVAKDWIVVRARRLGDPTATTRSVLESFPNAAERQAEVRLATMAHTNDGFKIAEIDLQLRGPGDFFGTRQSGIPEFKVANIITDASVLQTARADAFALVARDPHLRLPEHRSLADHLRTHFHEELSLLQVG